MQRGFVPVILILVLALVIFVAGFYYIQTKSNLKTNQTAQIPSNKSNSEGSELVLPSPSPQVISDKPGLIFTLPSGWKDEYKFSQDKEEEGTYAGSEFENYTFTKGEYKLTISSPGGTGRGACTSFEKGIYKTLNNKVLGNLVVRDIPGKEEYGGELYVCADIENPGIPEYGTKVGGIYYNLPPGWDEASLGEMDTIVESIRLNK